MSDPDLPPQLEDPTGFPDGATAEVARRTHQPEPPQPPLDLRRFALLTGVLIALLSGSLLFFR